MIDISTISQIYHMKQTYNADAIYIEEFIVLLSIKISTSYILQPKLFIPLRLSTKNGQTTTRRGK